MKARRIGGIAFLFSVAFVMSFIVVFAAGIYPQEKTGATSHGPRGGVRVQMRNVQYHFTTKIAVHIETLNGYFVPTRHHAMPVFDDKNSFRIRISSARISIKPKDLANAMNSYVFARKDAPLKNISVEAESGKLKIHGDLHGLPFQLESTLAPTADGKIRVHAEKIHALHLPVKGLLDLLGVQLDNLIKSGKVPGVQTQGDDLILDPSQILPPPHIEGKVTAIHVEPDNIQQTFGVADQSQRYLKIPNYMRYEGNRLRFGKLTMNHSDVTLIDLDPQDPLDFFLDHYKEQLAAGYVKIATDSGIKAYVKDYDKLAQ